MKVYIYVDDYHMNKLLVNYNMNALVELHMMIICEGEKNHKKGGLNCVFGNFFFYVLDNCPQVQSLK